MLWSLQILPKTYNCSSTEEIILLRFFYMVCEAIGTAATPGLLCQPRVIVKMNSSEILLQVSTLSYLYGSCVSLVIFCFVYE
jgi:hypothetical protein